MKISSVGKGSIQIGAKKVAQHGYDEQNAKEIPDTTHADGFLSEKNEASFPVMISRICGENGWQCAIVPGSDELWILLPPNSRLKDAMFIQGSRAVLHKLQEIGMYIGN